MYGRKVHLVGEPCKIDRNTLYEGINVSARQRKQAEDKNR